jgi:RsiW-degrading membrane proteinase PrsW (M82 family)
MAFYVFVGIAFSAEFAKFLSLRLSFYRLKSFESPIEGIIYATFIGLGYSMIAVPLFAYGFIGTNLINDLNLFLFTYPLANIVFAICMGYFVGLGKIRKNVFIDKATGVFVATFFHGLFIFSFITKDERLLILTGIGFVIIAVVFISRAVKLRKMQD